MKIKRKIGSGPPPLYAEDVDASKKVYNSNTPAGRRLALPLFFDELKPLTKKSKKLSQPDRAIALVADDLVRNHGISRLENGRFDTENVAFYVTFNPFLRTRNTIQTFSQAFDYYHMKRVYPIGSSAHWSLKRRTILVACRGTKSSEDFYTDFIASANLLTNRVTRYLHEISHEAGFMFPKPDLTHIENLQNDPIYKRIATAVKNAQLMYPKAENDYFATGHSLGGAIADELLRHKLVEGTVNFNPLVSPYDTTGGTADPTKVQRIYTTHDFIRLGLLRSISPDILRQFDHTVTVIPDKNAFYAIGSSHLMHNFDSIKGGHTDHNKHHLVQLPHGTRGFT